MDFLPPVPVGHLPTVNSSPCVLALEFVSNPHASAPICYAFRWVCVPVWDTCTCSMDCLCGSYSIQSVTGKLFHFLTASNASLCPKRFSQMRGCHPWVRPSPAHSSLLVPSFLCLIKSCINHIFPSSCQGLLPVLSWFSARSSASENVFLIYPWGEMYSSSTYSSAILSASTVGDFITALSSTDHLDRKPISKNRP